ncbi:dihydroorotate dehydrogenase [Candidatus Woesearchaeota archaeon]|nr:dihydroorotate dehydrogenase [Candidatus Woesearchaeota archaeon]
MVLRCWGIKIIETRIGKLRLKNPTILASGILGVTKASLLNVAQNGAGAVTMKSVSREPRKGHSNPILLTYEAGMMNAVGYSNPGIEDAKREFTGLKDVGVPVIASIIGTEPKDFSLVREIDPKEFSAVEIPLSCPHTPGFGLLAGQGTPEATSRITKIVKKNTRLPVIVKLSPNIPAMGKVCRAAEKAGADAINMGNTHGPGMVINIETAEPVLDFRIGGVSGPAIRPIAVRCVYDVYESAKIPIIGCGGVQTGRDAVEMIMAGASAVGIGTGIYYRGIDVFSKVCDEMEKIMVKNSYNSIKDMRGAAHER